MRDLDDIAYDEVSEFVGYVNNTLDHIVGDMRVPVEVYYLLREHYSRKLMRDPRESDSRSFYNELMDMNITADPSVKMGMKAVFRYCDGDSCGKPFSSTLRIFMKVGRVTKLLDNFERKQDGLQEDMQEVLPHGGDRVQEVLQDH